MYSFPKIFQLGTVYVADIFKEEVEITEKVDGSHFKFWIDNNGELITSSRGQQIYKHSADKLFQPALEWVHSIQDKLVPDYVYYGETLCRPRHNVLTYTITPKNHFALFGVSTHMNTNFLSHESLVEIANKLGCDVVPLLFKGIVSEEELQKQGLVSIVDKYLETESFLGGCKVEGIVIKNHSRNAMIGNIVMPIMNAKYVSEAFKEKHSTEQEWLPQTDKIHLIFKQYRTEARWRKSIQHLKEAGQLENSPRDIGKLLKEINVDIIKDHKQEIMEDLWKLLSKKHQGCWTHGFPEFYKRYLLEEGNKNE